MIDFQQSLDGFTPVSAPTISDAELKARIVALQARMARQGVGAV